MHIRSRIERVFAIRPGEGARTALMFFTILLLIASYTTTKAVRDAVFLSRFGLTELSYMYIGIAVVAGVVVTAYKRVTGGFGRNVVALGTNGFVALTLVGMAIGLHHHVKWISWGLYFWSGVFGLVLVAEFWLFANDLFDAREAKRLFPIIGGGAILGGLVGGAVPGWLAKPLGAGNLLYIVAAELVVSALLSHVAWKRRRAEVQREVKEAPPPKLAEGLAILRKNRYVRLIALMLLCMTVSYTIVQWQYKGIAKIHFGGRRDDMAAFFGMFAVILNLATFVLQILGTPRLLRRWGVGFGLRVLPTGFGLGALVLVARRSADPDARRGGGGDAVLRRLPLLGRQGVDRAALPADPARGEGSGQAVHRHLRRSRGGGAGELLVALPELGVPRRSARSHRLGVAGDAGDGGGLARRHRARAPAYIAAYRRMLGATEAEAQEARRVGRDRSAAQLRVRAELDKLGADDAIRRGKRLRALSRLTRKSGDLGLAPDAIAARSAREADRCSGCRWRCRPRRRRWRRRRPSRRWSACCTRARSRR